MIEIFAFAFSLVCFAFGACWIGEAVRKYTVDGGEKVDYETWKNSPEDLAALDRQVALIARVSPVSHPQLFPTKAEPRSYWINTYNTLILQGVLEYWPLESVRDVKISITSRVVPGKGFFYDRKVVVGGGKNQSLQARERSAAKSEGSATAFCPELRQRILPGVAALGMDRRAAR